MTTKKEISPLSVGCTYIYKEAKCILMNSDITNIYQRSTSLPSHISHCLNQTSSLKPPSRKKLAADDIKHCAE